MEKIIMHALKSKFDNAELIAKIANSTPNPRVAVEMLLGIYTPLTPDTFGKVRKAKYSENKYYVVKEVRELENKVIVDLYRQKTITVWYKTKEDYQDDKNRMYDRISDYYTTKEILTKGIEIQSDLEFEMEDMLKHPLVTGVDLGLFVEACEHAKDPLAPTVALHYDGTDL